MCLPSKPPQPLQDLFKGGVTSSANLNHVMEMTRTFGSLPSHPSSTNMKNDSNLLSTRINNNCNRVLEGHQDDYDYGGNASKQCIQHNYHDHANDDCSAYLNAPVVSKGGVSVPFPIKLHNMLDHIDRDEPELSNIVSWQPHGRCFLVKNIKKFTAEVLPRFFEQKKYPSFQRQLNLYGFNRLTKGPDKGSYYHELFLRSKKILCRGIQRMKIKGTGSRMASNPDQEPNFYLMDPCPASSTDTGLEELLGVSASIQQSRKTGKVVSPLTPPAKIISHEQQQGEEATDNVCTEMPPIELPHSVLSSNHHIKTQDPYLTSKLQEPPYQPTTTHSSLMEVVFPEGSSSDDLIYVFGGMPFHSLNVDTATPSSYHLRRNSCYDPAQPIIASDDDSAPTMGKNEKLEREMSYIADLLAEGGDQEEDYSSDLEISHILDKIVDEDIYFNE